MEYFSETAMAGGIGIAFALFSWFCSTVYAHDPMDNRFFGTRFPMALFGIFGYAFIALTAWGISMESLVGWQQAAVIVVNHLAVAFAALFTIYLVWKAIQVRLFSPGCILCWGLNVYFAVQLIIHFLPAKEIVS